MVTIDPEFRDWIVPLRDEEYKELKKSILEDGCRDPLVVWKGIVVDGHHRYKICTENNIHFNIVEKEFEDRDSVKLWMVTNQIARRNLESIQRIALVMKGEELIAERAKENLKIAGENYGENHPKEGLVNLPKALNPIDTRKEVAAQAKVSEKTYAKGKEVLLKRPEVMSKIVSGETSIHKEYTEIKNQERKQELIKKKESIKSGEIVLPKGVFEVITIDPPWGYETEYDVNGRRAASPYPEMSLEDIKNIQLPAADDCILFLWTTHKFMRFAFEILDEWEFRDVAIITWVKDKIGLGSWLRSQSEFCIMAVKGSPKVILSNQTTVLNGVRREHSRKPEEFYDMVNSLCIGRKLDYFSREKREGWEVFGDNTFTKLKV